MIGKSNFRLRSDITSKELTLQVVYDVLRLTPFYKAFLVTADVPEIYMQEIWATATIHHHSIHFKMNNKKRIVSLEYFKEMLHICPRIPNQTFDELSFEEEILEFLRYLGHSGKIKKTTDLSQAEILWGMYHKKNMDFAYLLWEDFVYQVEHKDAKKSNETYYPRFTKVIIKFLVTKDPLIIRRNKFSAILPVASGAAPPKTKVSVRKTQSILDITMPPPIAACTRLLTSVKGKQPAKSSKAKGLSVLSEKSSDEYDDDVDDQSDAADDDDNDQEDEDEQDDDDQDDNDDDQESDNDDDDFVHLKLSTHDEEAKDEDNFDPIVQTPSQVENSNDESNDDESHDMNVRGDEGPDAEDDDEELYRDVNINLEGRDIQMIDVHTTQVLEDTHETLTPVNPDGQQQIVPLLVTAPTLPPPSIPMMSQVQQAPAPTPTTAPSTSLQDLLNFGSLFEFDHRLKTLEANFSEFMQTNQFAESISCITMIVDRHIDHRMNEAVKVAVQLQSDRLQDEVQSENEDFINKLNENIQKIIKEQVKVQVSNILPKIEKTINELLEAKVLTRSSSSSKIYYVMTAALSKMELKKILIETMESNKSIHRSDEQRILYKALRRDDTDKDEEPSTGSDRGSKRRREGKEPESTSDPKEKASKTTCKSTEGSKSHQKSTSESAPAEEPMQTTQDLEEPSHQEFETCAADDQATAEASQHPECDMAKQADSCASSNKLMDTPIDFSAFLMNRLNVDTMTPELLAGPTYELMKGSCKSLVELEFFLKEVYKETTDQLDWNNPEG
nr:hypothetical protein [Tanacetum cinerariifolium]